jgi:hypothetical protein
MVDYVALKAELDAGHPDTGAYDLDSDIAASQLNTENRVVPFEYTTPSVLWESLAPGAITGLSNPKRADWDAAIVPLFNTAEFLARGNILAQMQSIFGLGSPSYASYINETQELRSRVYELRDVLGTIYVTAQEVEKARTL